MNVTSITIQWDRVNCIDRNGPAKLYRVLYYPTADPSQSDVKAAFDTGDRERMFSISRLPPRTSYTFEVSAINNLPNQALNGPAVNITARTTAPQGKLDVYRVKTIGEITGFPCVMI